ASIGPSAASRTGAERASELELGAAADGLALEGPFEPGDVDLDHLEHRLEGPRGSLAIGAVQHLRELARDDLPRDPELVLEPAADALHATVGEQRRPVAVDLGLVVAVDRQRDGLRELEVRAAIEADEGPAVDREAHGQDHVLRAAGRLARRTIDGRDPAVRKDRRVEARGLLGVA